MNDRLKIKIISFGILLALLASSLALTPLEARAASILPNMEVTLVSGNSTYAMNVHAGRPLIFRARVKNTGNVPLQIIANLTVPQNWDVDQDKYSDCPDGVAVSKTCTVSWYFTPQAAGQVYLRVFVRGVYTDSTGATNRITRSPAFIFNVASSGESTGTSTGTGSSTTTSAGVLPNMAVTLTDGNSTYSDVIYAGKPLIFRAQVKNTGTVPLQVTANLTVPLGWEVDQDKFSDCPESLAVRKTCTISWYFTPQAQGQVILRVYLRSVYTTSSGGTDRITRSPAFIFNVKPAK
jgi:hypothetical protein